MLQITEDLALRFGQTIGGLLNATFGKLPLVEQACPAARTGCCNLWAPLQWLASVTV